MNGDTCKFSHEPLTDESRQLLDKVECVLCYSLYIIDVVCAVFVNVTLRLYCTACFVSKICLVL